MTETSARPQWIDRADVLEAAVERWRVAPVVALDTEFVFERTFRPRLGIIQVAVAGEIALVDAARLRDLSPLARVFASPGRKLLHSGSGDVPILRRAAGVSPRPLYDTQIAAAFAGLGPSLSYAALVRLLLGIDLPKHETRTDWLRRPLSPEQVRYAAEDVEYLPALAVELERRLEALGRSSWVVEESAALADVDDVSDPGQAWRRVKGLERLPASLRPVARALAAWREREAERRDLARPFLLRDETLVALAKRSDFAPAAASTLPGYDPRRHASFGSLWSAALQEARAEAAASPIPDDPVPSPAERDRRKALDDAVGAIVARRAAELGLPPELLLSRRQRDRALGGWDGVSPLGSAIGGFRGALLGPDLDTIVVRSA